MYSKVLERVDDLDRKILSIIMQNARLPYKDIAEQCGLSRAAVYQRVQRLYDIGIVTGSGYFVNEKLLGYQLCTFVGITLEKGNMYKSVVKELEKIPEVVENYYTLGQFSMLIKMYAHNDQHLMQLLTKLQEIEGVAQTQTLTALEQRISHTLPIK